MMFPSRPLGEEPQPEASTEVPYHEPTDLDLILADKVLQWRCKVFIDLGMTIPQARKLALDKAVDTNFVRGLVARGCAPTVAFDIAA